MNGVPADDRGLTLGVGLFETVLALDGRLALWNAHLDRLERGCRVLSLPAPDRETCRTAAAGALNRSGLATGRAAVRLTWTGGGGARGLAAPPTPAPRLLATASPVSPPPESLALHTSTIRRNPSSPAARLKSLAYLDQVLARTEAVAAGAEEALMLDPRGMIACAAAGNIFWFEGERLVTPALSCGVLDGVVRAAALKLAPGLGLQVEEVEAPLARLRAAEGAFLTNSLTGPLAVRRLDDVELPRDAPAWPRLRPLLSAAAEATGS